MAKRVTPTKAAEMAEAPSNAPVPLDPQAIEIRRAAVEFAINVGADKGNVVALASTIEGYIRHGMPKP